MQYVKWQALRTYDFGVFHVSVRIVSQSAGFTVDNRKRSRNTSALVLVTGGSLCFQQDGLPDLTAKANDLCLLPQDCRYLLRFQDADNSFLLLNFKLMTPTGEPIAPGERISLLQSPVSDPKLLHFLEKLPDTLSSSEADAPFRSKEQLYRIFSMLFAETRIDLAPQPKFAGIAPGVQLLEQRFLENLPIA